MKILITSALIYLNYIACYGQFYNEVPSGAERLKLGAFYQIVYYNLTTAQSILDLIKNVQDDLEDCPQQVVSVWSCPENKFGTRIGRYTCNIEAKEGDSTTIISFRDDKNNFYVVGLQPADKKVGYYEIVALMGKPAGNKLFTAYEIDHGILKEQLINNSHCFITSKSGFVLPNGTTIGMYGSYVSVIYFPYNYKFNMPVYRRTPTLK